MGKFEFSPFGFCFLLVCLFLETNIQSISSQQDARHFFLVTSSFGHRFFGKFAHEDEGKYKICRLASNCSVRTILYTCIHKVYEVFLSPRAPSSRFIHIPSFPPFTIFHFFFSFLSRSIRPLMLSKFSWIIATF